MDEEKLAARARKVLSALGCDEDAEISVFICDDKEITFIHKEYFGIDEPTNVISFSQNEGEFSEVEPQMLGDVVISYETAARDAIEAGHSLDDELIFLLIHGILHLSGYDHEGERVCDAPVMEAKEDELFRMVLNG